MKASEAKQLAISSNISAGLQKCLSEIKSAATDGKFQVNVLVEKNADAFVRAELVNLGYMVRYSEKSLLISWKE